MQFAEENRVAQIDWFAPACTCCTAAIKARVAQWLDNSLPFSLAPFIAMPNVIQVFGLAGATCTRRVVATLLELGLPYEIVLVDLMKVRVPAGSHDLCPQFTQLPHLSSVNFGLTRPSG